MAPFVPSRHGFRFRNAFQTAPALRLGPARIGNIGNGLCGGMIYAARDFYEAGLPIPSDDAPPAPGTPLVRYLVRRLIDSWALPLGWLRYYAWMQLAYTDRGPISGTWRRSAQQWEAIRADLDAGHPSPLGLVPQRSLNPARLPLNHQVLAYRYAEEDDGTVEIWVYDPNTGPSDAVSIRLHPLRPHVPIRHNVAMFGTTLHGFFRTAYRPKRPPVGLGSKA